MGAVGVTMLLVVGAAIVIPLARVLRAAPMRALHDE